MWQRRSKVITLRVKAQHSYVPSLILLCKRMTSAWLFSEFFSRGKLQSWVRHILLLRTYLWAALSKSTWHLQPYPFFSSSHTAGMGRPGAQATRWNGSPVHSRCPSLRSSFCQSYGPYCGHRQMIIESGAEDSAMDTQRALFARIDDAIDQSHSRTSSSFVFV